MNANITYLPQELIPCVQELLQELQENKLEVCMIPSIQVEGVLLRVPYSVNPKWYKELCSLYPDTRPRGANKRKPRTKIKRKNVLDLLESLLRLGKSRSQYAPYLVEVAQSRHELYNRACGFIEFDAQF